MKILTFGEILWDIIEDEKHLGGAPLNLAAHLSKLGAKSSVISGIGSDELGNEILKHVEDKEVDTRYIHINKEKETGTVDVKLSENGIPSYEINENVAYDFINLNDEQYLELCKDGNEFDAFCFGTLAQRNVKSRETLQNILDNIKAKHIFYDVNLRQNYYSKDIVENSFQYSNIVKLNDEEVIVLSQLLYGQKLSENDFAEMIIKDFDLSTVCITRGENGCMVVNKNKKIEVSGIKINIGDTVGAGDAFSAGFIYKLLTSGDLKQSAHSANKLGSYVASKHGAIPNYSDELLNKL